MKYVKTAVSVPLAIFERAEAYAVENHLSRSSLVAKALEDYLYRAETKRMKAALDEVYGDEPSPDEQDLEALRRKLLDRHLRRLDEDAGEPW